MTPDQEQQYYQDRLRDISVQLAKLSEDQRYIERLVKGDSLLPLEQGLRFFIEQFRD